MKIHVIYISRKVLEYDFVMESHGKIAVGPYVSLFRSDLLVEFVNSNVNLEAKTRLCSKPVAAPSQMEVRGKGCPRGQGAKEYMGGSCLENISLE